MGRQQTISIHALREEGDDPIEDYLNFDPYISIHALREEGDDHPPASELGLCNFYPRPPRGGRQNKSCKKHRQSKISIHALREEGDPIYSNAFDKTSVFLSTPSARRATL